MFGAWQLSYEGTTFEFGTREHTVQVTDWGQDADVYAVDDAPAPRADGVFFGQDFVEPGEITIGVKIDFTAAPYPVEECVRLAMQARAELARVWRADMLRSQAGALADLTIGGEFIVEGRPRRARFDDTDQNVGLIYADLPFVPAHHGAYLTGEDGGWHSETLGLVPAQVGGLKAPLKAPLRTSVESTRAAPLQVGGDAPAWPVLELQGPIQSSAQIEVPGRWRIYLNRALGWNQTARIDTRPGRIGTYLNNKPVQLLDPRSSLLSECSLLPGPNVLALRGSSIEGTASVSARWRDTKGAI
ncbi:hypothetical protein [Leucobacter sp.]